MALTPAFVLHRRPYRESSALIQVLSWQFGKMSAVVRVKASDQGILQPFVPLLIEIKGRSSLKTLTQVEAESIAFPLSGEALYCGFYVNELLYHLLPEAEAFPLLYQKYQSALLALARGEQSSAAILRQFELSLLTALGYALPQDVDIHTDAYYCFVSGEGWIENRAAATGYPGYILQQLSHFDANDEQQCHWAKRLCREILDDLLSGRVLQSRELLLQHRAMTDRRMHHDES
ncbi:DNA repair protein RecO [Celerinatantimonas sp. YJH-8]|uniref:DNA repair protein RecO n=1 Tax=Celerinatantimonas sp. YJH-8 TaxID=3228714 RepID=UPI0038C6EC25